MNKSVISYCGIAHWLFPFRGIRLLYFLLLQLIAARSFAQQDTLIFYPVNNKTFQQADIRGITGDQNGKLWLCTNKGVASFDGNEVIYFGHKEGEIQSFWSSSISFLHPVMDKSNNLYVVTAAGQTYYFNTKTGHAEFLDIRSYKEDSSYFLYPKPYADILIEGDSVFWGARYNMGLVRYGIKTHELKTWSLFSDPRIPNTVNTIKTDPWNKDRLWLATSNGIYVFYKSKGLLERRYTSQNSEDPSKYDLNITSLEVMNKDSIWFVAPGKGVGLYSISEGSYRIFPYDGALNHVNMKIAEFNVLKRKSADEYFVGLADGELSVFNVVTHQYSRPFRLIAEMPLSKIQDFYSDSSGNYWILIAGRLFYASTGKVKFRIKSLSLPTAANKRSKLFKSVLWDQRKQVYYAVFDHSDGIYVLDAQMKHLRTIPFLTKAGDRFNSDIKVTDIGMDRLGRIWASSDRLYVLDTIGNVLRSIADIKQDFKYLPFPFNNLVFREQFIYALPSNYDYKVIYKINTETLTYDSIKLPSKMLQESGLSSFGVLEIDHQSRYAYLSNGRVLFQLHLKTLESRIVKGMGFNTMPYAFFDNFHWYCVDDDDNLWVSSFGSLRKFDPVSLAVIKMDASDLEAYLLQTVNLKHKGIMAFYYSTGIILEDYRHEKKFKLSLVNNLVSYLNPTILFTNISYANDNLFAGAEMDALQFVNFSNVIREKEPRSCYLSEIEVFNKPFTTDTLPEYLKVLRLDHNMNFVTLTFSSTAFSDQDGLEYRYKLDGVDKEWINTNYLNRKISYQALTPGKYIFHISIKNEDGSWSDNPLPLQIIIVPAWWQTDLFRYLLFLIVVGIIWFAYQWRIRDIRRKEKNKSAHERELLVLEAKALRAQMNPHFIFNCLNSIKSLIQEKENEKAIGYLAIFSKLIRTLFNNANKKEISLHDEIETCKLYMHLETLRFGDKLSYTVYTDPELDLKSVQVPALIIQPFIENAIWHGIMPRETGGKLELRVQMENKGVAIIINDDGIGRAASQSNKQVSPILHQSRGVGLTQSRLELDNYLQQREATIQIIDKIDESGEAAGTTVKITIKTEI